MKKHGRVTWVDQSTTAIPQPKIWEKNLKSTKLKKADQSKPQVIKKNHLHIFYSKCPAFFQPYPAIKIMAFSPNSSSSALARCRICSSVPSGARWNLEKSSQQSPQRTEAKASPRPQSDWIIIPNLVGENNIHVPNHQPVVIFNGSFSLHLRKQSFLGFQCELKMPFSVWVN